MARKTESARELTARQREWLRHLQTCHGSGKRVKDYAAEHGIPVQTLYQAAKRLRKRGLLEPSGRRPRRPKDFLKVVVAAPPPEPRTATWRIRLPSGAVFESATPLTAEGLIAILERLAHSR